MLQIEFARISSGKRLTLVLHPGADNVQTLWAYSAYEELDKAVENLRERECTKTRYIGYISIPDNKSNCQAIPKVLDIICKWAAIKELDAVVWTDLSSNFKKEAKMDFNEDNVITYLGRLEGKELEEAEKYVRRAPKQVTTRVRHRIEKELAWTDC